jgi:hypothetical protein
MSNLIDFDSWRRRRQAEALSPSQQPAAMPPGFKYTEDQATALHLLAGPARHTMLYGGSRSGKTFLIVSALVARSLKAPGSRHAIFRHHLKVSIDMDTLPAVMAKRYPTVAYHIDKSDWFCRIGTRNRCFWRSGRDSSSARYTGERFSLLP